MPSNDNSIQVTVFVEDFEEQIELKLKISSHETIEQLKEKVSYLFYLKSFLKFLFKNTKGFCGIQIAKRKSSLDYK
jgi:hypothetical protein